MIAVACGDPRADLLGFHPPASGPVTYLAAEDGIEHIDRRIFEIAKHIPPDLDALIDERFQIMPLAGCGLDITTNRGISYLLRMSEGQRLVVLDTLSRIHCWDENSNGEMARLVTLLEQVAHKTGTTILYVHHTSKAAAIDGRGLMQQASRGASVLTDHPRYVAAMQSMSAEDGQKYRTDLGSIGENHWRYVQVGIAKVNYGRRPANRWLRNAGGGVLLPADDVREIEKAQQERKNGRKSYDEANY